MPQMAPMSWMLIYMYFILMFIMKIYFNKELNIKNNLKMYKEFKINWKWTNLLSIFDPSTMLFS